MPLLVALALLGLALLTVAADQLVLGAGRLGARLGVSAVVVGVVVIGLGTSAPEFVVSGLAAGRGDAGLALGNLVGSNIINVTLILGVASLVAPVVVRSSVPRREAPLAVAGVFAFCLGALMYYTLFYRSRLVPRWLSGWGVAGVLLMLTASLLALFSNSPVTGYTLLILPLAVQEIVLAIWLLVKGFNPSPLTPRASAESS